MKSSKFHSIPLCVTFLALALKAWAANDLNSAYSALGFDPWAPGNKVVVVFSDAHLDLDPDSGITPGVITTNLDPRLVNQLNAMSPQPTKILVTGDVSTSYATAPGQMGDINWYHMWASNEMSLWKPALLAITNIAQTNILWVPGNHDQDPRETNAEYFRVMFPDMPTHQALDIGGVRFFMLNGGNINFPSDFQTQWLRDQVAGTSPTQTVAVLIHQPIFAYPRGNAPMIRDVFKDWPARFWLISGHCHCMNDIVVGGIGRSNVAECSIGSVSTNQFGGQSLNPGFEILCLSNGIAGRIYYYLNGTNGYVALNPPDWANPLPYVVAFENVNGLLWRREKNAGPIPSEVVKAVYAYDAGYYFAYTAEIQLELPLYRFTNSATRLLLMCEIEKDITTFSFSTDRTNWIDVPVPDRTVWHYDIPIPPSLVSQPTIYFRAQMPVSTAEEMRGWGLATTNPGPFLTYPQLAPIPNQSVVAGRPFSFTNIAVALTSPPDKMTFSLLSGPPGATVDAVSGVFSWLPPIEQAPTTVSVSIKVADNGSVPMCATQQFSIMVTLPAGPVIASPQWSNNVYNFTVSGDTGLAYTVWASTNLLNWDPLWTSNLASDILHVTDTNGTAFPSRFYRATVGPAIPGP